MMKKRSVILIVIASVVALIGLLGGTKALQIRTMMAAAAQMTPPPEPVTTATATKTSWESALTSVGSLAAVQGVTVSAEVAGKIVRIAFQAGAKVKAGQLLVQQDVASERAQLRAATVRLSLAETNLARAKKLLERHALSAAEYDDASAREQQAKADADNIRAIIDKKTVRAPFAGRLGIRLVNLGQVVSAGEPIVSLQSIDPMYVNFLLPQQYLDQLQQGLQVRIKTNALPGEIVEGKITAINPQVDSATRNVEVQATIPNPKERLRPGMFADVTVVLPTTEDVLAIPATAVLYAPYSDSVFVVKEAKAKGTQAEGTQAEEPSEAAGAKAAPTGPAMEVQQQFIRLGTRRGDFVAVTKGLQAGDMVVSTGVFKLRNGQSVVIDNTLNPKFELQPKPPQN